MLIDWFTVAAQIINFLILVALLKHFLYGPVLRAMATREEKIATQLRAAQAEKEKARAEADAYLKKNKDWETERLEMFTQAKEAAKTERNELIVKAHQEVDLLQAKWHETIEHQKTAFLQNLRKRVIRQVYDTARRVLKDLANADLEDQITTVFIQRLKALDHEKWEKIAEALQDKKNALVIESAFEVSQKDREKITGFLEKQLQQKVMLVYKIEPGTICGLTLKSPGHKIAWDLNDYLEKLEEEIAKTFMGLKTQDS